MSKNKWEFRESAEDDYKTVDNDEAGCGLFGVWSPDQTHKKAALAYAYGFFKKSEIMSGINIKEHTKTLDVKSPDGTIKSFKLIPQIRIEWIAKEVNL